MTFRHVKVIPVDSESFHTTVLVLFQIRQTFSEKYICVKINDSCFAIYFLMQWHSALIASQSVFRGVQKRPLRKIRVNSGKRASSVLARTACMRVNPVNPHHPNTFHRGFFHHNPLTCCHFVSLTRTHTMDECVFPVLCIIKVILTQNQTRVNHTNNAWLFMKLGYVITLWRF